MGYIYINSIMKNPSLCDGLGYRTVLFLQGSRFILWTLYQRVM